MNWFYALAALIASATVWYVARPLARSISEDTGERRDQLEQLRERLLVQLNELDIEEGDRNIDANVVGDERRRLEAELAGTLRELESLGGKKKSKKAKQESRQGWVVGLVTLGVLLPLTSAGLYALGQRHTLSYLYNSQTLSNPSIPPMALEMVARLEKRLAEQPNDAAGWRQLGRAYSVMGKMDGANVAYDRAYQLNSNDPELISEYAAFLYNQNPQNTTGRAFTLYSQLLKLQPENQNAMWFLGIAAFQQGKYKQALGLWERLLVAMPPGSQEAEHLRLIVSKTREKLEKK
jgi:cytochrome c-type biogenesis protein CcmH